jgi:hypothetical protein
MKLRDRIVITGVGLTCPIGNSLPEYRANLLEGRSGVSTFETRYIGPVLAGVCRYDELRYLGFNIPADELEPLIDVRQRLARFGPGGTVSDTITVWVWVELLPCPSV